MMQPSKRFFLKASFNGAFAAISSHAMTGSAQLTNSSATSNQITTVVKILRTSEDVVREKRWAFLIQALDCTVADYGPYLLETVVAPMSAQREVQETIAGDLINVMASDCGHPDLNVNTVPVPIPIDRGLLGYRVALIRREEQSRIQTISDLEAFRGLTIGQGRDWGDVPIYQFNKIPLITNSSYPLLFAMLSNGRFDIFPRGIVEIIPELSKYQPLYGNIGIDKHLLIKYPYAEFFYVSRRNPVIAERIFVGLEIMRKDGTFDAIFNDRFSNALNDLHLERRTLISLEVPPLPSWVPTGRAELWLNPLARR